jgi:hypothetical protein
MFMFMLPLLLIDGFFHGSTKPIQYLKHHED